MITVPTEKGKTMDYKHQYESMKKMVTMYQDEIVPGLWEKIKELEKQVPKWIPVTERLPETTCVNLALIGELPFLAYYDGKEWRSSITLKVLAIDHWMPIPEQTVSTSP